MGLLLFFRAHDLKFGHHFDLYENKEMVLEETAQTKTDLRSLSASELVKFLESFQVPRYRAGQLLDWLHQKHAMAFSEMRNIPEELKKKLSEHSHVSTLKLLEVPESRDHESIKYLMQSMDGHILESVLIVQRGRRTVCVSTQLGCRIRCTFCASGKGPFGRNLSAGEIVEQVSQISRDRKSGV